MMRTLMVFALLACPSSGFMTPTSLSAPVVLHRRLLVSQAVSDDARAKKIKQMMMEESMDPASMAATADRMKNMKPEEMDVLIKEIDDMDDAQRQQLKAMGMDPTMMKMSMKMMKENPAIMQSAQRMMEKMSPEEMVESSRMAQQQMGKMSPEQMEQAAQSMKGVTPEVVDEAVSSIRSVTAQNKNTASDPALLDTMFKAAEYMCKPPTGGVNFRAFATLAPIAALVGERESDLTVGELEECWEAGSGYAKGVEGRVDRAGFQKVWTEVKELFEDDIMAEARDPNSSDARAKAALEDGDDSDADATTPASAAAHAAGGGGGSFRQPTPEELKKVNSQIKDMSPEDLSKALDQMQSMGPAEEARMQAMGVDPEMMKKSIEIMKGNPMMMKAAQAMIGKISPEQMAQAQKMASGMSKEDMKKAMDSMK